MKKREGQKSRMKTNKKAVAYILVVACLLLASVILYYIVSDVTGLSFDNMGEQRTKLEFISENNTNVGFSRKETIYTENGITSANLSGKITVNGTAEISIISEDGNVVYSDIYTNVKSRPIKFELTGLSPYSYYTMKFSSEDAQSGSLTLTSGESLLRQPEKPTP